MSRSDDVQLAIQHLFDGIVICNHDGRQLDGVPATLDILREVAPIVNRKIWLAKLEDMTLGSSRIISIARFLCNKFNTSLYLMNKHAFFLTIDLHIME